MVVSLSNSTRRDRAHHHAGCKGVKIKVNLLAVRVMLNDDYACYRLLAPHGAHRFVPAR